MQSQTRIAVLQSIFLVVALSLVGVPALAGTAVQPTGMDGTVSANAEADATNGSGGGESLAGETVTLHVSSGDGIERATFSFEMTENGRIEGLERGARENATVEMRTDRQTFERVAHAPNPERAFRAAIERGDVETRVADDADDDEWNVFSGVEELARSLGL
ncbi:hypothetical protein OB920_16795 [Halobacteria archaeon HArc-gm2]|nr:hypothetical protein [Halobacteria archaeon HArc-gm2]